MNDSLELAAGQVWSYKTRPGETGSRVAICKIEKDEKLGEIVHISVSGLSINSPTAPGGKLTNISHMPYTAKALRDSVVAVVDSTIPGKDYEEGYRIWKSAFDKGEAGVFAIPLSEAVAFMEAAINK